jgi:hypothetical protein
MDKQFGAIERDRTPQDISLGSFNAPTVIPVSYMPSFSGTIEDQNKIPACGSHSGQSLKQILENFRGSPEYLWKKIKQIDGIPAESGTDLLSILKTLNKTGITSIELMPNNTSDTLDNYTDPSKITAAMDTEAAKHKVGPYAFAWNPTMDDLKQAIYTHKAVILLLRVGKEFWTDKDGISTWDGSKLFPLNPNYPITSGHFVVAFAYDENYIYFVNEWSSDWGNKGIGYFGKDYMSRCVEIGTTVNADLKFRFTKDLKLGMTNSDVKQLQKRLGVIQTSFFGSLTLAAVKAYQIANGIPSTGYVGTLTRASLNK